MPVARPPSPLKQPSKIMWNVISKLMHHLYASKITSRHVTSQQVDANFISDISASCCSRPERHRQRALLLFYEHNNLKRVNE